MTSSGKWTEAEIVSAIREQYLPAEVLLNGLDEWSVLTQVPSAGATVHNVTYPGRTASPEEWKRWKALTSIRSIDVLLVRNWGSGRNPYERVAIEVKVSRSDFARDTPEKRAPWIELSHKFAYAVPEGLLSPADIPEGCWLIEVSREPCDGKSTGHKHSPTRVHWNRKVRGERRNPKAIPVALAVQFARTASRAEAKILTAMNNPDDAASLVEDLRRTRNALTAARERIDISQEHAASLAALLTPLVPVDCADCGRPLKVEYGRYKWAAWTHKSKADTAECHRLRLENGYRYDPPIEPTMFRKFRNDTGLAG